MSRSIAAPLAAVTAASETNLVTILTDSPASADSLRDEVEATNVEIEVLLSAIGTKLNLVIVALETHGILTP